MLTPKQHELLLYIEAHLRETGCSPSFEEMKAALDLRSKSGIHRLISALEERGFLRRHKHRARALEVVRLPQDMLPRAANEVEEIGFEPTVIQGGFGARLSGLRPDAPEAGAFALPLYGKIAAGLPIEALRDSEDMVEVPASLLGNGEHFALVVEGDSMIEAGILNGDIVIIRRGDSADNGQIIVALVDQNEVTLKRLRRKGQSIALEPANARYETRIFPPERVRIQGHLVGLLRRY